MEKKHYLMRFEYDYGDEITAHAIQVFTETELAFWKKLPVLHLNDGYDKSAHTELIKGYELYWNDPRNNKRPIHDRHYWSYFTRCLFTLYLGNYYTEGLEKDFESFETREELIEYGWVSVKEITEDFYNEFKALRLDQVSLSDIFKLE